MASLLEMLAEYSMSSVPCVYPENDFNADPKYHGGYWGPWITPFTEEELKVTSSTRTLRYSLFSALAVLLYCIYYRYVRHKRICKSNPVKYKP